MCDLKTTIMRRDGLSSQEADELINEAKWRVTNGDDPQEVLQEMFQLELDYFLDLM
jgi:hypothetical protein